MFEAIVTLCLSLSDGPCRDHLMPGYEADTRGECTAALATGFPTMTQFPQLHIQGVPRCELVGEALSVTEVATGIFVHVGEIAEPDTQNRGDVSNAGFIIGEASVAVIDTGSARWMGEALWRSIRIRTDKPVSHVILTHMHPDHVLGAGPFADAGAEVVGHVDLTRALADRMPNYLESMRLLIGERDMLGTNAVSVDVAFEETTTIDLGGRVLDLRAWPVAHTGTDVTVLDRESGTFFAGDLVFELHTPALDGRLTGWRAVLETLQSMDLQQVVPGHGGPALDWPVGADAMRDYLEVLETDTRAAIEAGTRMGAAVETIAQSEAGLWALFETYNPRNATVAFTELEWE